MLISEQDLLLELTAAWFESGSRFSLVPNTSWVLKLTTILSQKFLGRQA